MKSQSLFIVFIINIYCFIYALAENSYYIVSIRRDENDKNYDDESLTIQSKIDELVNERMNDIYQLIIDNKDSYILENGNLDEKLNELNLYKRDLKKGNFRFINPNRKTKKNNNQLSFLSAQYISIDSNLVTHLCPISNYYAIKAYLSDIVAKKVEKLPNVIKIAKNRRATLPKKVNSFHKEKRATSNSNNNNNNSKNNNTSSTQNSYYNIEYIKKETQWRSVSIEKNAPLHLSLISQNNFNKDIINSYDTNYYYPDSAGKGIDIYFIDAGINFNHVEFDSEERTVSCDARIVEGRWEKVKNKSSCYIGSEEDKIDNMRHGTMVASVAAGKKYGVAKKANIHMIATEFDFFDLVIALDYILVQGKANPHKTIINVSRNGNAGLDDAVQHKINDAIKAGFIITASSGNRGENICFKGSKYEFISGYNNVIGVGGTDNDINSNKITYNHSDYSNYGECITIHAPGYIEAASVCENGEKVCSKIEEDQGTSFSSPIVAGIAALIMSEDVETRYDYKTMLKKLSDMSVKGIITDLKSKPNQFINNGKHIVYSKDNKYKGCGVLSGNQKCDINQCCTKNYKCTASTNNLCYVENGCQSEFGNCQTNKNSYSTVITNINNKGMTINTVEDSMNTLSEFAKVWLY